MKKTTKTPTPRFFKIARIIGLIGISILFINFFYQLWRTHGKNEDATVSKLCDLQTQSCTKHLPNDATLTLSLTPRPIAAGSASSVEVTLTQIQPKEVDILVFPYPATEPATKPVVLNAQGAGVYTGKIFIKQTSTAKQHWVAMVILGDKEQQISAPFQFDVVNP